VVAQWPASQAQCGDPLPVVPACCIFFIFFCFDCVRERVRRTEKVSFFAVRPIPAARQSPLDAVTPAVPSVTFVCRAPHVTHGKVCSPCVIEEGARQREFYRAKSYRVPFAVRFIDFVVRSRRTAKHVFPVVKGATGIRKKPLLDLIPSFTTAH
jgi:hypothetical protein